MEGKQKRGEKCGDKKKEEFPNKVEQENSCFLVGHWREEFSSSVCDEAVQVLYTMVLKDVSAYVPGL